MNLAWIESFFHSVVLLSTPLIFAALGGTMTKKTGMFNMALEGMMLITALAAVAFANMFGNAWFGFLGAVLTGIITGALIAFCHVIGKTDLYLTCIALNLAATGGTVFVMYLMTGDKANTMSALKAYAMPTINIPLIEKIPLIGPIISGHNILTYMAFIAAFLVWFLFFKTRLGLRLRSVGENPHAAESVGISVPKIRIISFLLAGILCGIGGAFMSMGYVTFFGKGMVAGRGYIGLSAMNIADGSPFGAVLASLFFGSMDAITNSLQNTNIPVEFVKMIPYLATIIGLVIINIMRMNRLKRIEAGKLAAAA